MNVVVEMNPEVLVGNQSEVHVCGKGNPSRNLVTSSSNQSALSLSSYFHFLFSLAVN